MHDSKNQNQMKSEIETLNAQLAPNPADHFAELSKSLLLSGRIDGSTTIGELDGINAEVANGAHSLPAARESIKVKLQTLADALLANPSKDLAREYGLTVVRWYKIDQKGASAYLFGQ